VVGVRPRQRGRRALLYAATTPAGRIRRHRALIVEKQQLLRAQTDLFDDGVHAIAELAAQRDGAQLAVILESVEGIRRLAEHESGSAEFGSGGFGGAR
jgi:hypothetical protein